MLESPEAAWIQALVPVEMILVGPSPFLVKIPAV